ncbi:hypothetical protein IMSAGC019_01734 [Lachnospiraceae bacterium]|nr:hypothetical protein IMSAGC019_01734 [Lachnospiraceae bacterium]
MANEGINILIIVDHMLPYTRAFGSCQRIYYLANYLSSKGCNVSVISEKREKINRNLSNLECRFKKYWVENKTFFLQKYFQKLSHIIFNDVGEKIAFENYKWSLECRKKIFEVISEQKIDILIISGPPFSAFSLVKAVRKKDKNVKIILDYRDPWNLWENTWGMSRKLESRYISDCDRVVCFCDEFKTDMEKFFPQKENSAKYDVVYNGYQENLWKNVESKYHANSKMIFEFIGSLEFRDNSMNFRNPFRLIDAFLDFSLDKDVELIFIGLTKLTAEMKEISRKSGGKIKFFKAVSAQKSLERMVEGDILITINYLNSWADRYALSGKLFDYLRSGRVIWGIGAKRGALRRFILENKVGVFCENNEEDIKKLLNCLYDKWSKEKHIERKNDNRDWSIYSREYQNEKYYQIIKNLMDIR